MQRYNPKDIEPKWQQRWAADKTYAVDLQATDKPKYYGFAMLPYPSGTGLHTGHVRTYTLADVTVRAKRQQGYNAYNPIGWDAFGLPAENYAIKTGTSPQDTIAKSTSRFREQLTRIGMSHDWSKEVNTSDPAYYKWTQWIFTQLFEQGLAYQKQSAQWWCPVDQTVLANEQVEAGKCWRCGNVVEKKLLKQWFFRITDYADELLESAEDLDWPAFIKTMQRNWIGRSRGAEITFQIVGYSEDITVFTTRADTIFSAACIILAPEHPLVQMITTDTQRTAVSKYVATTQGKSDLERQAETDKQKSGVFSGAYAINPANGEHIPIWIGDFVLVSYGTGAIFGDIHDERDFAFLKRFEIPARATVVPDDVVEAANVVAGQYAFTREGVLIDSAQFSGMRSETGRDAIISWLAEQKAAKEVVNYKIRDWLISRQRYWGAPIPIVFCETDGAVAVPDDQLPVVLPVVHEYQPNGGNTSVLAGVEDWVNTTCPRCGGPAKRETDTMDGYACSSWYFLRYLDPHNEQHAWDPAVINRWMPIDMYNGADHAVSHLLYARFWTHFFHKLGLIADPEPVKKLIYNAYILATDGTKMSKSKGNVVDPLEIIESGYGADALRVYEMFIAPYDLEAPWDTRGVPGCYRFLQRSWNLVQYYIDSSSPARSNPEAEAAIMRLASKTIKKVTEDIAATKFNTAIAAMMEAVNGYLKLREQYGLDRSPAWKYAVESLVMIMAPFGPHIAEELWQQLGKSTTVHIDNWPQYDPGYLVENVVTIVVQVNGKLRGQIQQPADADQSAVEAAAKADANVAVHLDGKEIVKAVFVPSRLINFVIS